MRVRAHTHIHAHQLYSKKFGIAEEKMNEKLWGDNYFDAKKKAWVKKPPEGNQDHRCFNKFIMEPISTMFNAIMNDKKQKIAKMLKAVGVEVRITRPLDFTTEASKFGGQHCWQ